MRDYRLAIRRPSTVAVASILNALERVRDGDYESLTTALLGTLKEFDFDPSSKLLAARDRLHCLMNGNDEIEEDGTSEATRIPPSPLSVGSSDAGTSCVTVY